MVGSTVCRCCGPCSTPASLRSSRIRADAASRPRHWTLCPADSCHARRREDCPPKSLDQIFVARAAAFVADGAHRVIARRGPRTHLAEGAQGRKPGVRHVSTLEKAVGQVFMMEMEMAAGCPPIKQRLREVCRISYSRTYLAAGAVEEREKVWRRRSACA